MYYIIHKSADPTNPPKVFHADSEAEALKKAAALVVESGDVLYPGGEAFLKNKGYIDLVDGIVMWGWSEPVAPSAPEFAEKNDEFFTLPNGNFVEMSPESGIIRSFTSDWVCLETRRPEDDKAKYMEWRKLFPFCISEELAIFLKKVSKNQDNKYLDNALFHWNNISQERRAELTGLTSTYGCYDGLATIETNEVNEILDDVEKELKFLIEFHGTSRAIHELID